ncbi:CHAD domain-containing protein [Nodosilinea nodulosa]|uniref:CHAD domain-containing protein n=1 Tax=Nodosilinea nodulosa TaxID=416001 RepID=UPI000317AA7D|nr:CHAD domain-containing protein [Nodosilinea nodulosa]
MATAQQNATLGKLAHAAIAKYLKHATAYKSLVLADTDPENLHQMRVGLRRLRTAVQVFDAGLELPKAGREAKIARLGKKLGQLRDLDVVGATLRDRYAPDLPDSEQQGLDQVLLQLANQRHKSFKQVKKLLKGKPYRQLKQSLSDWVANPTCNALADLPAQQVMPDLVMPLISQLWLHPGWLVGTKVNRSGLTVNSRLSQSAATELILEQGTTLHSLRKQVKRVRYQLRLVADLYPDTLDDDIQRLSTLQEILGDLQDSTVLEASIGDVLPDAKAQMPTLFALLTDRRHRAWKQWQGQQQHYLDNAQRQRLRLALLNPGQIEVEDTTTTTATAAPKSQRRSTTQAKPARSKTSQKAKPASETPEAG